jgi:hypothetical protein
MPLIVYVTIITVGTEVISFIGWWLAKSLISNIFAPHTERSAASLRNRDSLLSLELGSSRRDNPMLRRRLVFEHLPLPLLPGQPTDDDMRATTMRMLLVLLQPGLQSLDSPMPIDSSECYSVMVVS